MELTAHALSQATHGEWTCDATGYLADSISTDTRQLRPGDLFFALQGENFDAHEYLEQAVEKGASALVLRRDARVPDQIIRRLPSGTPVAVPVLKVDDTLRALGDAAGAWRAACPARRTAIVGSTGKTTTKEMLAAMLRRMAPTHVSPGNFNNLIGLPLTLLALERGHSHAVLELGMNEPGELTRLTEIAEPDLLLLLSVGTAHIGQFDSLEALLEAKAEAVRALRPGVPILYDATSANTRRIVERWGAGHPLTPFGSPGGAGVARASNVRALAPLGYAFTLELGEESLEARLPAFGRYNVANAVAAAAAARLLGVAPADIVRALAEFRPAAMRSELRQAGGVRLIVDCYNANPDSMRAALESLAESAPGAGAESGRTFLVLGEMLELGNEAAASHEALGRQAAQVGAEDVLLLGASTRRTLEACRASGANAHCFASWEELADSLIPRLCPGDRVLFKGSRGNALERAVERVAFALNHAAIEEKE